ncbi:odorant receptor 7a-like [Ceratitis capitata]|uniref:odorant receptor 7a-like n=1 Tax=Ceratitis capitata TaxID=7213 RepID=UPI000A11517E|nr:odorant receptor 7a-like [Ceratitis capitata]
MPLRTFQFYKFTFSLFRYKYLVALILNLLLSKKKITDLFATMADTAINSQRLQTDTLNNGLKKKGDQLAVRTEHATNYLFNGFRVLGIYMPARRKWLYSLYSLIPNSLVTLWLPLSFVFSYFTMSAEDLVPSSLLTSIQVAINVIGCSVKIVVMAFLLPKLRKANAYMDRLDARCKDEDEIAELRKIVKQGNRFVVLFAMSYWSYASSTFIGSVTFGRPPYDLYNPFIDWRKSKLEFVAASLIEFALMDVACFQQVVDDSYAVIYVCILRTHMNILLKRLGKLATCTEMSLEQNLEELKLCIRDHKNLLGLYNIVAPIISITIFIQFMITASILSATLINIFIFANQFSTQVASCFYILAVVVEVFPLCYYAQCLMDDSDRLSQQIFHANWIEQDVRFRKMLIFFMQRTQRVMELNAGKIFPITLGSFLSIAKFSFSLYTLIEKMGIRERLGLE